MLYNPSTSDMETKLTNFNRPAKVPTKEVIRLQKF